MSQTNRAILPALLAAGLIAAAGCGPPEGPPNIGYVLPRPQNLAKVGRVVFLQLADDDSFHDVADDMTTALSKAIGARRLFHVDVISRDDPACKGLSLDGRNGFTIGQLQDMRRTLKCDAVLVGSVRDFRPHPHTQMGLYLRLLDVKNGRLLWAVDHLWDTTDKDVEKRIQKFFRKHMREGYEPMDWQLAMISPKAFEKYVAYEVAETLPAGPSLAAGGS